MRGGVVAGPGAEDQKVGQRVAPKAIGSMHAARNLTGGKQSGHVRFLRFGIDPYPSHHVVTRRADLHGFLGDVDVGELPELVVHGGEPPPDVVGVTPGGDVQVHTTVRRTSPLLDLGNDGPGPLRRGAAGQGCGERSACRCTSDRPLPRSSAVSLRNISEMYRNMNRSPSEFSRTPPSPRTPSVTRIPRTDTGHTMPVGWELDELHVDEVGAGGQGQSMTVAGVFPGVRRHLVGLADPTGGQHNGGSLEGNEAARLAPVAEGAGDPTAVLQQVDDRALHEHVDIPRHRLMLESADQLEPGPVPDVGQARVAMTTKITLQDAAVLGPVEEGSPVLQLVHPVRRFLGVQLLPSASCS